MLAILELIEPLAGQISASNEVRTGPLQLPLEPVGTGPIWRAFMFKWHEAADCAYCGHTEADHAATADDGIGRPMAQRD